MPALPCSICRVGVFLGIFVAICVINSAPQKVPSKFPSSPKYDIQSETKMKATVQELKLPAKGNEKEAAHLLVQNGSEAILDVYLCPEFFLADMGISFAKGDEIALTGSKVKQGEAELILAREVVKGSDTLVLRDDKGKPVWSGRRFS